MDTAIKTLSSTKGRIATLLSLVLVVALFSSPAVGQYYAYVTNPGDFGDGVNGDLSIIDLATDAVVATVPLGEYPQGVAINPAGTAVYIGNTGSNDFTVIDASTYTATTLPAGPTPCGVAVHPDGTRVYLANTDFLAQGVSTVWVLDRATNTVIDEIACGSGSIAVEVHPDGKVAYVANVSDGTIAVFDTTTHEVIDTIVLEAVGVDEPSRPVPMAVHPEGTYVYVANREGPTIWAINTATHEFVARPFGNRHVGIAVNPAGTLLYLPSFDDADRSLPPQGKTVDVIDARTLELITTIDGFDAPLDVIRASRWNAPLRHQCERQHGLCDRRSYLCSNCDRTCRQSPSRVWGVRWSGRAAVAQGRRRSSSRCREEGDGAEQ